MKQDSFQDAPLGPCLRADLEFWPLPIGETEGATVKDPVSGRLYRFGQVECFVLALLDGIVPFPEIQKRANEQFDAELDDATLVNFVESLYRRGLMRRGPATKVEDNSRSHWRRHVQGSWLYMRFKLLDPDRMLDRMLAPLNFCFSRRFVIGSLGLAVLALMVFISNTQEFSRDIGRIFVFSNIIPTLMLVLATTISHEFAHGLTCKHYGGRVHEMGFLLLFFQPALYCNVSDAWTFPEKIDRMWVGMAGTFLELVLWSMAVLIWRITAPETAPNFVALVLMGTSGVRLFLNLNPLIKLDGYYVLSDWLDIPNLRPRAFSFLGVWIKRPWSWSQIDLPLRERRIYLCYGLFGAGFTVWILGFILTSIAGFLTKHLQGIGFVLLVGFLALLLHKPVIKMFKRAKLANPILREEK